MSGTKYMAACRLVVHVSTGNGAACRYRNLHLVIHHACADDDNHHLVLWDAEALLYVEELATHEATREGYAA